MHVLTEAMGYSPNLIIISHFIENPFDYYTLDSLVDLLYDEGVTIEELHFWIPFYEHNGFLIRGRSSTLLQPEWKTNKESILFQAMDTVVDMIGNDCLEQRRKRIAGRP